ncbi:hypothetical protein [Persicobacter psychrovividus]|uniref:Uncharacterized protein n=1 Tax=Persicobacter psychrovividus TaxID=387638 RepID=A0ABN6LAE9_9BACT|nr:hypothetical protein PEPS_22560 [Persicobacter psychrovividus]
MKTLLLLLLIIGSLSSQAFAQIPIQHSQSKAQVIISQDGQTLTVDMTNRSCGAHTTIDLSKGDELGYKTRVVRYFGGLLKQDTYPLKNLVIITAEKEEELLFNRSNINLLVHSLIDLQ